MIADNPTSIETPTTLQEDTRHPQPPRDLAFHFTGNGWEYFKIWIVNLLLTIATLGIYSAWATVRTTQYFYGNTLLDQASFRFTAKPLAILIGRLIAVVAFVAFSLAQEFVPPLALILIVLFLVAMPAIIVRSMAFRLRHSTYRNVAFRFQRNYRQAYSVFMAPIVTLVALMFVFGYGAHAAGGDDTTGLGIGIAMLAYFVGIPFFNYLATAFYVNNSHYGESRFTYAGNAGGFYRLYGMSLLVGLGAMIPAMLLIFAISGGSAALLVGSDQAGNSTGLDTALPVLMSQGLGLLILVPVYTLIYAYFQAKRFNLVYNNSILAEQHGFRANLRTGGLAWLYLGNMLLILFTLGLGTAWAKIRSARYHLQNLEFLAADDLSRFTAAEHEKAGALGDQIGEVFDLEVGL